MNKGETWFKMYRSLLDWEWYNDDNTKILFLHLLLIVNITPQTKKGVVIPAGSIDRTQMQLAAELGLSRQQLRRAISNLKSTHEITTEKRGSFTVFTIVRWNDYQKKEPRNNQESNQSTTKEEPRKNHLNKNSKNIRMERIEEEEILPPGAVRLPDGSVDYENVPSNWDW